MNKEQVLKEFKRCVEAYMNHVLDENYTEINDIKIGDIFISSEIDEDGYVDNYFILCEMTELNNEILLIECDEDGYYDTYDFDSDEYYTLDYYIKKNALHQLVKDLGIIPKSN